MLSVIQTALSNPETPILFEKCPAYSRNLNPETPGDSTNELHFGEMCQVSIRD